MRKYANPADEAKIQNAIASTVCNGKSVVADAKDQLPSAFRSFAKHEVAICAAEMIANGLLIPVDEGKHAVWVINAANGYKQTMVVPAKGLQSIHRDSSKPSPDFWKRNQDAIWLHVIKHIISALIGGLVVWLLK